MKLPITLFLTRDTLGAERDQQSIAEVPDFPCLVPRKPAILLPAGMMLKLEQRESGTRGTHAF